MQVGVDTQLHELRVSVESRTHLKAARAGDEKRGRELRKHVWGIDGCDQRILGIRAREVAEAGDAATASAISAATAISAMRFMDTPPLEIGPS